MLWVALVVIILGLGMGLPLAAQGAIYKWINADGSVGFSDDLGKVPEQHRQAAVPATPEGAPRGGARGRTRRSPPQADATPPQGAMPVWTEDRRPARSVGGPRP